MWGAAPQAQAALASERCFASFSKFTLEPRMRLFHVNALLSFHYRVDFSHKLRTSRPLHKESGKTPIVFRTMQMNPRLVTPADTKRFVF